MRTAPRAVRGTLRSEVHNTLLPQIASHDERECLHSQDLVQTYLAAPTAGKEDLGPSQQPVERLCWLLLLDTKHRLLPDNPDLVSLFHLLLAVVSVVHDHAPAAKRAVLGDGPDATALAALVEQYKGSLTEVHSSAVHSHT